MKAVLFDIDNTLLIKRPTIPEKWHELLTDAGYAISMDDALRAFAECEMWVGRQTSIENKTGIRMSDEDFLNGVIGCCIEALGIDSDTENLLAPIWCGQYEKHYELSEGAMECLAYLRGKGIKTGIVSNNHASVRDVLAEMGLIQHFDTVVISDEVGLYKPDPAILLYACEKLGVAPEGALYVGDHPFDVVCANDAGVHSAWIPASIYMMLPTNTPAPMFRIASLTELLKLI